MERLTEHRLPHRPEQMDGGRFVFYQRNSSVLRTTHIEARASLPSLLSQS